jgi:hypothetical protein
VGGGAGWAGGGVVAGGVVAGGVVAGGAGLGDGEDTGTVTVGTAGADDGEGNGGGVKAGTAWPQAASKITDRLPMAASRAKVRRRVMCPNDVSALQVCYPHPAITMTIPARFRCGPDNRHRFISVGAR